MKKQEDFTQEELLLMIYESTEKTRKYILWGRVMSVIYLLIIVAPIVLAIIYLPPLVEKTIGPYQELLEKGPAGQNFLDQLMKQYK